MRGRANRPSDIWARIVKAECWLWQGSTDADGYGVISIAGAMRKASRLAWEQTHGPIPGGASVLHTCDVRACIRPAHLFLGTSADNSRDMVSKCRQMRGVDQPKAKLTEADVAEIRRLGSAGASQRAIAAQFGISQPNVGFICRRETWRHVA